MKKELHFIWLSSCVSMDSMQPADYMQSAGCCGRDGDRIVLFQNGSPDSKAADVILELIRRHLTSACDETGGRP